MNTQKKATQSDADLVVREPKARNKEDEKLDPSVVFPAMHPS